MKTISKKYSHQLTSQDDRQEIHNLEIEQPNVGINSELDRYPYCIVWTMLPLLSCIMPSIGHTGICTSDGVIHDFGGPYYIAVDNFTFGRTHKYVRLDNENISAAAWDEAVIKADDQYRKQMHNIITNNCHSHVACVLNHLNYKNRSDYTMFSIWIMLLISGRYVNVYHCLCTWVPILVIISLVFISFK